MVVEPAGGEGICHQHSIRREYTLHFLQKLTSQKMFGNIVTGESVKHDVVVFHSLKFSPFDKYPGIHDSDRHIVVLLKEKKLFRHIVDCLVYLHDVYPGLWKQVCKRHRDTASAQPRHQNTLRPGLHQQAGEAHSRIGKHEFVRIVHIDAGLISVSNPYIENQTATGAVLHNCDIPIQGAFFVDYFGIDGN